MVSRASFQEGWSRSWGREARSLMPGCGQLAPREPLGTCVPIFCTLPWEGLEQRRRNIKECREVVVPAPAHSVLLQPQHTDHVWN